MDELYIFLESLSYPSVVLLTEHWLKEYVPLHVPDYLLVSRYARKNSVHGITLILLHVSLINKLSFINVDTFDELLVEKEFKFSLIHCANVNMYILCIYRPPSSNIANFLENL